MPKRTPELLNFRRNEIIDACERLYETKGFKEITMADIAEETTFTRSSIYNYFRTKEEIFLALLQREYDMWSDEIDAASAGNDSMTSEEMAGFLAGTLGSRKRMLRILSMNHYDMESGSRLENLTEFKRSYGRTLSSVAKFVRKFSGCSEKEARRFVYSFFPFLYGLCPYTEVTEKQREAMSAAGIDFEYSSAYDLSYRLIIGLLTECQGRRIDNADDNSGHGPSYEGAEGADSERIHRDRGQGHRHRCQPVLRVRERAPERLDSGRRQAPFGEMIAWSSLRSLLELGPGATTARSEAGWTPPS